MQYIAMPLCTIRRTYVRGRSDKSGIFALSLAIPLFWSLALMGSLLKAPSTWLLHVSYLVVLEGLDNSLTEKAVPTTNDHFTCSISFVSFWHLIFCCRAPIIESHCLSLAPTAPTSTCSWCWSGRSWKVWTTPYCQWIGVPQHLTHGTGEEVHPVPPVPAASTPCTSWTALPDRGKRKLQPRWGVICVVIPCVVKGFLPPHPPPPPLFSISTPTNSQHTRYVFFPHSHVVWWSLCLLWQPRTQHNTSSVYYAFSPLFGNKHRCRLQWAHYYYPVPRYSCLARPYNTENPRVMDSECWCLRRESS